MVIKNYDDLKKLVDHSTRKTVAVAAAHDSHTLEALFRATKQLPLDYILVGKKEEIKNIVKELGEDVPDDKIIDSQDDSETAQIAVNLVRDGKANLIMKGILQTSTLLKVVVNREHGIRKSDVMQHVAVMEAPSLKNLLFVTDGGMLPHPTLEQKKVMLGNMIDFMRTLGYDQPKIAALASSETVSEKMAETTDAVELQKLAEAGEYGNAIVEGPMAFDVAISSEVAKTKGIQSKVAGAVDGFIVPDIVSGNVMFKVAMYLAEGKMAGLILGAQVPIVLSSRGASADEKFASIILCLLAA